MNASDLPLAVPVVTIVGPRCTASSASAWCDQSDSIPTRPSDSRSAGCRPSGRAAALPGLAPQRAWVTSCSPRPASSSESQGIRVRTVAKARHSTTRLIRSFHHSDYPLERLLELKREPVTAILPAREVAGSIGRVVDQLRSLDPLIDQVLVVDAASSDRTAELAARSGAEVHQESELMPELGPAVGKGDAMWRALSVARGELVVYLDSDTEDFPAHFALGLLGPLIADAGVDFVKGDFGRAAGRVTELTARPLLRALYPELAGFGQPLAGEVAARRGLLERIPFATGYAVEIAMLLDVHAAVGLARMAQVHLGERHHPHQPLAQLGPMADSVLGAVLDRLCAKAAGRRAPGSRSVLRWLRLRLGPRARTSRRRRESR